LKDDDDAKRIWIAHYAATLSSDEPMAFDDHLFHPVKASPSWPWLWGKDTE
jgi:hypothetical protein